jgi:hypothetical protein
MFVKPGTLAKGLILLLVPLLFLALFPDQSFARGFGRGLRSFRGGSRLRLPSRGGSSLFSKRFSWGGRSRSSGLRTSGRRGFSAFGRSSRLGSGAAGRSTMSRADRALFERARTRGTAFSTRNEALKAFKRQNQGKFQTRFSSRPTSRPAYIPRTITGPNGSKHSVEYRPGLGGYGYYNPSLGRWVLYSVLGDALMTNRLMRNQGYYYGGVPPPASGDWGFSSTMGAFLFLALLLYSASRLFNIRRNL